MQNETPGLFVNSVHPRFFLGPHELEPLRRKAESGVCREIRDELLFHCESVTNPASPGYLPTNGDRHFYDELFGS